MNSCSTTALVWRFVMCIAALTFVLTAVVSLVAQLVSHPLASFILLGTAATAFLLWAVALWNADVLSDHTRARVQGLRRSPRIWQRLSYAAGTATSLLWAWALYKALNGHAKASVVYLVIGWVTIVANAATASRARNLLMTQWETEREHELAARVANRRTQP